MNREIRLETALGRCLRAMKRAQELQFLDHLDCDDDTFDGFKHGVWWYKAIEQAERALADQVKEAKP